MNTAAFGTALQKYRAVLYCTLLCCWYNWFVIYSQTKMACDSFSITGMRQNYINMTSDVNYIDIFFSFLTGVIRNYSAYL